MPLRRTLSLVLVSLVIGACEQATAPREVVTGLTLDQETVRLLARGDTVRLRATPAGVSAHAEVPLSWSSTDTTVATVSAEGLVRAVGFGAAEIRVQADTIAVTAAVTVGESGVARWTVIRHEPASRPESGGASLTDVWGPSTGGLLAVGDAGTIVRSAGTGFEVEATGLNGYRDIAGTPSGTAFVAGTQLWQVTGKTWTPLPPVPFSGGLAGMWVDTTGALYGVQNQISQPFQSSSGFVGRSLARYASGVWTQLWSETEQWQPGAPSLTDIWGRSPDDLFAVGEKGRLLRCVSGSCAWGTSPTTANLNAVAGGPRGAVYAVGDGGTILRFDGAGWEKKESGTTRNLLGVWASSEGNVYAVGQAGTLLRFDGRRWSAQDSGTTENLRSVWGRSAVEVYAVGDAGVILKGVP